MKEQARKSARSGESQRDGHPGAGLKDQGEAIHSKIDAALDDIDDVLEENAAEFVQSYIQRGGE